MTISPESNERDWDAEFAEITGHLDDVARSESAQRTSGANRDRFGSTEIAGDHAPAERRATSPSPDVAVPGFRAQWRVAGETRPVVHEDVETDTDTDDFVPAPPQPLESNDPATAIMLGCLVGGPVWLLYLTLFDRDTAMLWWSLAALTLVVGFVLAVMRQPRTRDDEGDDGARL